MKASLGDIRFGQTRPFWSAGRLCGVLVLAALVVLPGCGGCGSDPATEAEKEAKRREEERKKQEPEFNTGLLGSVPYEQARSGKKETALQCWYKPEHWTTVVFPITANKEDVLTDLDLELAAKANPMVEQFEPVPLPGVSYTLTQSREAALPKGQRKFVQTGLLVPNTSKTVSGKLLLEPRRGSSLRLELTPTLSRMNSYQYHLVVLARSPERYGFLKAIPSVRPPLGGTTDYRQQIHYFTWLLNTDRQVALPTEALHWTSTAYVFWDDADPKAMTIEQRDAMVDWLHWGGQIVVSGPGSLDGLRDSFLAEYLPATGEKIEEFPQAALKPISDRFTLSGQQPIAFDKPLSGVKLKLARGGRFIPGTGRLLAERRVGRGRVVVSAIRLSERTLVKWPGYDNFLNACLLRRPPRRYEGGDSGARLVWADGRMNPFDAALTCSLRYFTRDTGIPFGDYAAATAGPIEEEPTPQWPNGRFGMAPPPPMEDDPAYDGPGVAAWRDFGPVAASARSALRNAACVQVPGKWFVIWVTAAYLVVLVPMNWLVFWALGRVEWAWIAAPLIAIVCTFMVVRLAQLDIGFARSETEVGVVELQGEHPRAHLTRYTALYTSLTTDYSFRHEDPGTIVRPFPKVDDPKAFDVQRGEGLRELRYRHDEEQGLEGFRVASNLVDFVHSEQMIDLGGPVSLLERSQDDWTLGNRTRAKLLGVGVIRRTAGGQIETAWVGDLASQGVQRLHFQPGEMDKDDGTWWPEQRDKSETTSKLLTKGRCNIRLLIGLAEQAGDLGPGECRMVGWTNESLDGVAISPDAPQAQRALVVVAHLRRVLPGAPRPDVNGRNTVPDLPEESDFD